MHRVLRGDVLGGRALAVAADRLTLTQDTRAHSHDFLEIAVIEAGSAWHRTSMGRQRLVRGDAVVLRPGEWHAYEDSAGLRVANCYVGTEVFARELSWTRGDPALRRLVWPRDHSSGRIGRLSVHLPAVGLGGVVGGVQAMIDDGRVPAPSRAHLVGELLGVLAHVADAVPAAPESVFASTRPAVVRSTELLEESPALAWSMGGLARAVHLSPSHLGRLFTEDIGISPMRYLTRLRAEWAAALLVETDLQVSIVAAQVGWHDPNLLARRFRAEFGLSPTQYRLRFRAR